MLKTSNKIFGAGQSSSSTSSATSSSSSSTLDPAIQGAFPGLSIAAADWSYGECPLVISQADFSGMYDPSFEWIHRKFLTRVCDSERASLTRPHLLAVLVLIINQVGFVHSFHRMYKDCEGFKRSCNVLLEECDFDPLLHLKRLEMKVSEKNLQRFL